MKKRLVLGKRDIAVLQGLHLHGALSLKQLAQLCFAEVGLETARKRLRKLHQCGYIDAKAINRKEEKGRPEHVYSLNAASATALARSKDISEQTIAIGLPNTNHQEHLARLAELHLAWQRTVKKEKLSSLDFCTKRTAESSKNGHEQLNEARQHADAVIVYSDLEGKSRTLLVVLETGNLRQTRHWLPKMNALLKTDWPIMIVTLNEKRMTTLREWTLPLLGASEKADERCFFCLYDEIIEHGYLSASAYSTKGSITKILI